MLDIKIGLYKIVLFFSCMVFFSLSAQNNEQNNAKIYFQQAESQFKKDNYEKAYELYKSIDSLKFFNSCISYKIGVCLFNSTRTRIKSIPYFEFASKNVSEKSHPDSFDESNAPVAAHFYMGKAYHYNYEFYKAIEAFQIYKLYIEPSNTQVLKELDRHIETCNNALELLLTPVNVKIKNLGGKINSANDEYSPLIMPDESAILFTSRKSENLLGKVSMQSESSEDIFISQKTNDWQQPKSISENINTTFQEATAGLSFDGQTLFIYKAKGKSGTLYKSELQGSVWTVPEIMDLNQKDDDLQTHASISNERDVLYFVSDMPGGYGGKDIWMCRLLPNGAWGLPINLGPEVNSEFDDEAPFAHPDGKYLFFSSQGHKTMGGFDVFFVEKNADNVWSSRMNLGYPLNTVDDDIYYVSSLDGKRSYFSSNRSQGFGGKDIYMATFENTEDKPLTIFSGCIKHQGNKDLASKITINVKNMDSSEEFLFKPNIETGKYIMALNFGNYRVSYRFEQKEFFSEDIAVTEWIFNVLTKDVELNMVEVFHDCIEPEVFIEKNNKLEKAAESKTNTAKNSSNKTKKNNLKAKPKANRK